MRTDFSRVIRTQLSPEELWRAFASAVRNSEGQSFWPNELEVSKADSLRVGGMLHVVYKTSAAGKPVTYRIMACDPDQKVFTYKATKDHPMRGGATVKISSDEKAAGAGSVLEWKGGYEYAWYSPAGAFLRFYFLDKFFTRFEEGIRRLERRVKKHAA